MSTTISVDVNLTRSDLRRGMSKVLLSSTMGRLIQVVAVLLTVIAVVDLTAGSKYFGTGVYLLALAAVCALFVLAVPVLRGRTFYRRNRWISEPRHYDFTDDGVSARSESRFSSTPWTEYRALKCTRGLYILTKTTPLQFAVIPKRSFAGVDVEARFCDLAAKHVRVRFHSR
jgi:hypothetical protein